MNKNSKLLVYLVIFILLFGSLFIYFFQSSSQISDNENIVSTIPQKTIDDKIIQEKITEPIIEKQSVYTYEEALISGDVTNCNLVIDIDKQSICKSKRVNDITVYVCHKINKFEMKSIQKF